MKTNYLLFLIILSLSFFGCKKENNLTNVEPPNNNQSELGEKLDNPYSMSNMLNAIQISSNSKDIQPTHLYVRFLPATYEDMVTLESDSSLIFSSVPYGYTNSADLDYYQDPSIPKEQYTWQYAIVDYDYKFPNIKYEILDKIYRPSDDEEELENISFNETLDLDLNIQYAALFSKRYNPKGRILVQNSFGGTVPLRRAAIQVRTLWWSDVVTTNENGEYYVNRRYKDIPTVRLWNRNYTNKTTQRWTEHAGFWVSDQLGKGKDFNYTIEYTEGSKRDLWVKATINNAYVIYDDFAKENSIKRPDNVRTWVFKNSTVGGAPLLHNQSITSYSYYYPAIATENNENFGSLSAKTGILALSPLLDVIATVTRQHKNLPDIIIGTNHKTTSEIYSTIFHEAAHYSHKKDRLTNGYWAQVQYQALFDKTKGTYGDGSPSPSKYVGVAEAWSHFIEYELMQKTFPGSFDGFTFTNDNKADIRMTAYYRTNYSSTIPSNNDIGATRALWIPSGLLRDLIDNDNNNLILRNGTNYVIVVKSGIDRVSGFTYKEIYELLTEEVTSIIKLKDKIIKLYPNRNLSNEIKDLFELYGY
ncbi:hypothetical protein [Sphingobacterium rhinopitheci]|uniref:hypothetical protein n=1 Tax=Sphingobacterium rhinopitheci TaxID=2781960 RepID=UPI001F525EF2|nr:hypothetical protein [Sphingobacterium rhinopitheci]MCI0922778.1 hypothetical protein [Sphingobacterium rhinopitheci]